VSEELTSECRRLLGHCGLALSEEELSSIRLIDYGLEDPRVEGLQNVTLTSTDRLQVKVQVLLPNQTVPQHVHPPYESNLGKEESIRVLWGSLRVYLDGLDTMRDGVMPEGKEQYYTLRNECLLGPSQRVTILPDTEHWFQGGSEGCVALSVYTRADESRNRFADPRASYARC
jgi:D-lyxose ketol-isomerase